jgi:hypothetical protein
LSVASSTAWDKGKALFKGEGGAIHVGAGLVGIVIGFGVNQQ